MTEQEREALPPLPEPSREAEPAGYMPGCPTLIEATPDYYTADQMRAYARAALAATPAPAPAYNDATELALGKAYRTIAIDRPWLARDDFEVAYRAGLAATPAPATLTDRLRAKEAQEIASKFDTRAALEQARKDRAATPAPEQAQAEPTEGVEHGKRAVICPACFGYHTGKRCRPSIKEVCNARNVD